MLLLVISDETTKSRIIPLVVEILTSSLEKVIDKLIADQFWQQVAERAAQIVGTLAKLNLTTARDAVNNLLDLSFKWLAMARYLLG